MGMNFEMKVVFRCTKKYFFLLFRVLNTLYIVVDELRSVANHSIHPILQAVVGILSVIIVGREGSEDSDHEPKIPHNTSRSKKLRKECYRCLSSICTVFPASTFSSDEMKAVSASAVWPEIEIVVGDGICTITPLMRLLYVWSQKLTYHEFLAENCDLRPDFSPLAALVSILHPEKQAKTACVKLVMDVLKNLLNPQREDEEHTELDEALIVRSMLGFWVFLWIFGDFWVG